MYKYLIALTLLLLALPVWAQNTGLPNDAPQLPSNLYTTPSYIGNTGGVGAGANPSLAINFSANCPGSPGTVSGTGANSLCVNTPANTQVRSTTTDNCHWATTAAQVICASGPFVSADVGKTLWGYSACEPFQSQPITGAITTTTVTITSFVSSTTVGISASPANTVSSNGCVVWGTPDTVGAAALNTALQSATTVPQCPKVWLASAYYMALDIANWGFLYNQPTACNSGAGLSPGNTSLGNFFFEMGYEVEGRGPQVTTIYLPPDFPESGSCNHGPSSIPNSCFAVPLEGRFENFGIACGSGACGSNLAANARLINVDVGSLNHFRCNNIASSNSANTRYGISISDWAQLDDVDVSACGDSNAILEAGASATCIRCRFENGDPGTGQGVNLTINSGSAATLTCFQCGFLGSQNPITGTNILNKGAGNLYLIGGAVQTESVQITANNGYWCQSTGTLVAEAGTNFFNSAANATAITHFGSTGCTTKLRDSIANQTGTGNVFGDSTATGSVFLDEGGNTFTGGFGSAQSGGKYMVNPTSTYSSAAYAPTCTFTTGGGSTPSCAMVSGSTNEKGTIIASTGTGSPGTTGTVTLTFAGTFTGPAGAAPACTFNIDNSGTAWANESGVQINTQSTTAPVVAWYNLASGTLTALTTSSPYRIGYTCTAR